MTVERTCFLCDHGTKKMTDLGEKDFCKKRHVIINDKGEYASGIDKATNLTTFSKACACKYFRIK